MASASRVLLLGMTGSFSLPSLEALLAAGIEVCGVMVPGRSGGPHLASPAAEGEDLRVLNPYAERSIVHVAWEHDVPVYEIGDLKADETLKVARAMKPEVLAVACFDRLIPRELKQLARLPVNVHPSLLPANRGPAPLFWTFRLGLTTTGVTVHELTDVADAGPILTQAEVPVPRGVMGAELDQRLAELGGELLVNVVRRLEAGELKPQPQDESRASYQGWPTPEDWLIPASWPARRAFNFIRGVKHLGGPVRIAGWSVEEAVAYDERGQLDAATREAHGVLQVRMQPGVLTVRIRS